MSTAWANGTAMGIMMAKVPQEVPVEKPIRAEARNRAAGMNMAGRPLDTTPATQTPVPSSEQMAPMLQASDSTDTAITMDLNPWVTAFIDSETGTTRRKW